MHIHCPLMIDSVFSNDFPLILIILGNVLGLLGLILLDGRGDRIRTFNTERISGQWRMGVIWALHRALCS
jgi:hypothetical protein